MIRLAKRLLKCKSGATAVEYGLVAVLISVAIIGGATTLGLTVENEYKGVAERYDQAGK